MNPRLITKITAKQAADLSVSDLIALDLECSRRAIMLGRAGVVSKMQKTVRTALDKKLA
jgi:hypothetical protein